MNRHITVTSTAEAIDDAISHGLKQLSEKYDEKTMDLVTVSTFHRPHDGVLFVTIIAKGTGEVKAAKTVKPKKLEEHKTNE